MVTDNEKVMARAVIESIEFMTGTRPRSNSHVVTGRVLGQIVFWVIVGLVMVGVLVWAGR